MTTNAIHELIKEAANIRLYKSNIEELQRELDKKISRYKDLALHCDHTHPDKTSAFVSRYLNDICDICGYDSLTGDYEFDK